MSERDPSGNIFTYQGEEICLLDLQFCNDEQREDTIAKWLSRVSIAGGNYDDAAQALREAVGAWTAKRRLPQAQP